MSDILMTAITPEDAQGRTIIQTGISMVGMGRHDYFCGHCGRKIMHRMDISNFGPSVTFHCSECDGFSLNPNPPKT